MSQPDPAAPVPARTSAKARERLASHARQVAPLHWKILAAFLVLGAVGAGFYVYAAMNKSPAPVVVKAPTGASGFMGIGEPTAAPPEATDTWAGWGGAKGAALGFGFAGGFVIAFIFRAFLKLMTLVTVVVVGGLGALSYYHVLNIDFTAARQTYESNASWLTDQAARLKDALMAHLPGSSSGAVGAYFGLRRR